VRVYEYACVCEISLVFSILGFSLRFRV